ncbi:hypothetical protein AB1Y20_014717 [Prymnesium parvum]|uniref:Copper type II ascorbate-dependent monooxygenase C-terminal domain-containing protein n=1 Tax=Prymnesium parvum TaxID=97485 RepID=A0AB34IBM0_PRYPA
MADDQTPFLARLERHEVHPRPRRLKRWRVLAWGCICASCLLLSFGAALLLSNARHAIIHAALSAALALNALAREVEAHVARLRGPPTPLPAPSLSEASMGASSDGGEPLESRMFVGAADFAVPPGATYECFGPWKVQERAAMLVRFQPVVNLEVVHHMILFGKASGPSNCRSDVIYSWARTGQRVPLGLDLSTGTPVAGLGFEVGQQPTRAGYRYLSLQVHYQRPSDAPTLAADSSGVELTLSPLPSVRTPLRVEVMALVPFIPAHAVVDQCVRCTVQRGGVVFGYRNHAHRLGRNIWSDHFQYGKREPAMPPLGLQDSQRPQIFRLLAEPRALNTGDVLQLHCIYNATLCDHATTLNIDEERGEMCNQYLLASAELFISCGLNLGCVPSTP